MAAPTTSEPAASNACGRRTETARHHKRQNMEARGNREIGRSAGGVISGLGDRFIKNRFIGSWQRDSAVAPHRSVDLRPTAGVSTFRSVLTRTSALAPFGGEGGPQPALSPAGAGRVRGSKLNVLIPPPPLATQTSPPLARINPGPEEQYRWGAAVPCNPST